MWDEILKVFEHGSKKHDTIQPFLEQLDHIKKHYILSFASDNENDSGLPHKAHCMARLMLCMQLLDRGCFVPCSIDYLTRLFFESKLFAKLFGGKG